MDYKDKLILRAIKEMGSYGVFLKHNLKHHTSPCNFLYIYYNMSFSNFKSLFLIPSFMKEFYGKTATVRCLELDGKYSDTKTCDYIIDGIDAYLCSFLINSSFNTIGLFRVKAIDNKPFDYSDFSLKIRKWVNNGSKYILKPNFLSHINERLL